MPEPPEVAFQRLRPESDGDIPLPTYMTDQAAGMDIRAAVADPVTLEKGEIRMVPTGFAMALPTGYEAQIRPRSGLAAKYGIGLINSPGTIDADYRGEVLIPLINMGPGPYTVKRGDRIAQMVIQQVIQVRAVLVSHLDATDRGTGGFGHTGIH